jgi:tetratricopeptide (TPR) repeat protein
MLGWGIAFFAGLIYLINLSGYAFPHSWTTALTSVAGGHPFLPLQRPLWQTITLLFTWLPGRGPLVAAGLLSALLSALTVGLVYEVAYRWRRRPHLRYLYAPNAVRVMEESRGWAALLTALAACAAAPLFAAATTGHPSALDAFLFACIIWLSLRYRETESIRCARGAALLYSIGLVEHAIFIIIAPVMVVWWGFMISQTESGRRLNTALTMLLWFWPGIVISALFCIIYSLLPSSEWIGMQDTGRVAWQFLVYQYRTLQQTVSQLGWLLILVTTLAPAAYLVHAGFHPPRNAEHAMGQWIMRLLLLLIGLLMLFNVPGTPATLADLLGLAIPYLIAAFWIGQLTAFLLASAKVSLRPAKAEIEEEKPLRIIRIAVLACFALALVLTIYRYHPRQGHPLRDVSRAMLEALENRPFLVSMGYLDDMLFWEARKRDQDLTLIHLRYAQNPAYRAYLSHELLGITLSFGEVPTIDRIFQERFGNTTNLNQLVALEHRPEWWNGHGFAWFPGAGVYLGVSTMDDINAWLDGEPGKRVRTLLQQQREALEPRRLSHASLEPSLRILRHRLSVLANNLGYRYAGAGQSELAAEAFEMSLGYNLHNLSAMLNRIPLLARGGRQLEADLLEQQARRRLDRERSLQREDLDIAFGYLVDDPAMTAQPWWPQGLATTKPDPADDQFGTNQLARTLAHIEKSLKEPATRGPAALHLLAIGETMMHKDMMQTAIGILAGLPEFEAGQQALYHYALRQGEISTARGFLEQLYRLNPDDLDLLRARIEFERRQEDRPRMRVLVNQMLAMNPRDVMANYLRAEDYALAYRFEEAEAVLLTIEPEQRNALVHTGLALHTWKQGRHEDALQWIDLAIAQVPGHSHPVGVKGIILADSGSWEEALPLLEQAVEQIPPDRPSLTRLFLARTYVEIDQPELARPLLAGFHEAELDFDAEIMLIELKSQLD